MEVELKTFRLNLLPLLFLLGTILTSGPVLANTKCRNNTHVDVKNEFIQKLASKLDRGYLIFAACKPSPIHIDQTYAVIITHKERTCLNECKYNLFFLLADNAGNKITHLYRKENALLLNRATVKNVTLDTGLYQLSPFLRAAGIRIDKRKPEHLFQTYSNELYLFIEDSKTFRPLFRNDNEKYPTKLSALRMRQTERSQIDKSCNLYQTERARTIELGNYHNGFRDLIIKSDVVDIAGLQEKDGCAQQKIATTKGQTVITYDGIYYPLPNWLSP